VQNIESKSLAILHASLNWQSDFASHKETLYIPLNVWRELELLPNPLAQALLGQRAGFVFKTSFSPGSLVLEYFLRSGATSISTPFPPGAGRGRSRTAIFPKSLYRIQFMQFGGRPEHDFTHPGDV
jgi:hypothetical protein